MTLAQAPLLTTGASHSAQTFRMMIKDLSSGTEGVTEGHDLRVSALPTPGGAVQVGDGSAVIRGRASPWQGSYTAYNIGTETVLFAPTGSMPRSDLVVLRVLDPEFEGSLDPAKDQVNFFDVIPNVPATATTAPPGCSAIPLARIDIPPSTATITQGLITDLRTVAKPRRERTLHPHYATNPLQELSTRDGTFHTFPSGAQWSLHIPDWAATAKIVFTIAGLRLAGNDVYGGLTYQLGNRTTGRGISVDDNQGKTVRRTTWTMADTIALNNAEGAPLRGTTQTLVPRMTLWTNSANGGVIGVDRATVFLLDVEFEEGPL